VVLFCSSYNLGTFFSSHRDCGGQESFMDNYISSQRDQIFRNVELLIYVFDVESREVEKVSPLVFMEGFDILSKYDAGHSSALKRCRRILFGSQDGSHRKFP
jgi:hypothetical protein